MSLLVSVDGSGVRIQRAHENIFIQKICQFCYNGGIMEDKLAIIIVEAENPKVAEQ